MIPPPFSPVPLLPSVSGQHLLSRLGITPDLPADEAAYAPEAPRTKQATTAFQNLRAPLTVLLGLGLRVSVGGHKGFQGDLDAMVRGGMDGLSAVNPFALAWSQALPNIVNMVGVVLCCAVRCCAVLYWGGRGAVFSLLLRSVAHLLLGVMRFALVSVHVVC